MVNTLLPLADHGPEFVNFLDTMHDHPTKFASVERLNLHPESRREPLPIIVPGTRTVEPTSEFLDHYGQYAGYLFVSNVPHPTMDGKLGEYDDVLARQSLVESIADIMGVDALDVFPTTMTSGYVRYRSFDDAQTAVTSSQPKRLTDIALDMSPAVTDGDNDGDDGDGDDEAENGAASVSASAFRDADPASLVKITNITPGTTKHTIAKVFLPEGSTLSAKFDNLVITADSVDFVNPTTALVRLPSAAVAQSLLESQDMQHHLKSDLKHKWHVKVFPAKRSKIRDGYAGPNRSRPMYKQSDNQMVVAGEVPTSQFFLGHSGVIHLRNLSPAVTKKDLSAFFQPFSTDYRDESGSIEFVQDADGLRTDRAYVGFDLPGEADKVFEAFASGRAQISAGRDGAVSTVSMSKVKERVIRRGSKADRPGPRGEEELLDDLHNWERHVDPEDLQALNDLGITRDILDEIFVTLRYQNETFAAADQARKGERSHPEYARGDHYRRMVRLYAKTLLEVSVTPEEPGLLYEGMFPDNAEVDMSIFDDEKERINTLRKKTTGHS